jgi:hypothetical protein
MTQQEAYEWLMLFGKITTAFYFIPMFICLFKWKYFKTFPLKWLFIYFLMCAFLNVFSLWFIDFATKHYDVIGPYLKKLNIYNTFFLQPIFYLTDIICLGNFVIATIQNEKIKRNIYYTMVTLVLFTVINTFLGEGYANYPTVGSALNNIYIVFLAMILLRRIYFQRTQTQLNRNPYFWFSISLLISTLIAGLIDFLSGRLFNEASVIYYQAHIIVDIFYILGLVVFTYCIWLLPTSIKIK